MAKPKAEWRKWYNRVDWRRRRALQLARKPLCAHCLKQGKLTPATIVDHIEPHHGDFTAFMHGALQSLCDSCHAHKWADDRRGFGTAVDVTGRPIDPRHPANAVRIYPTDLPPDAPASPLGEDDGKPAITERARKR
jgi:5-methylcytosine-specific restriction endonuclease McrA